MTTTYFITGTNRGIGLALVSKLAKDTNNTVIASVRDTSKPSQLSVLAETHPNIKIISLDVASEVSILELGPQLESIAKDGIDVFISNAGYSGVFCSTLNSARDDMIKNFMINSLGPIETFKVVYPLMKSNSIKKVFFISSLAGSIGANIPNCASYGQSKASLNRVIAALSAELKEEGFIIGAINPGTVATDMFFNGLKISSDAFPPEAAKQMKETALTPEKSASDVLKIVEDATTETTGLFKDNEGNVVQW